jgi:stalled ribosome rescue protein Dom34
MSHEVGIWLDHKKAVIVTVSAGQVSTKMLISDVGPHTRYAGSQEDGGEKKYEQRHRQDLDRYYDDVINQIGSPDALLLFGPGEAKLQLKDRLGRSNVLSEAVVAVESADKLTEPQIVAKIKEYYGIPR